MKEKREIDYTIKPIEYKVAMDIVVKNHYLHRKSPCSFAFGLFDGDEIVGCICYGTPSSANLRRGICGESEKCNVIELTRLWVHDDCPTNCASFLIGNTVKRVDKEIIVSFADTSQGHVGIVYQATNWIYTGLSKKRTDWKVEGVDKHSQTLADKFSSEEIREKYGDKFSLVDRPRKHRYIYLNCKGRRKRELWLKIKYPIGKYPKR